MEPVVPTGMAPPDFDGARPDPDEAARLGFTPAYLDASTLEIYPARDATGRHTKLHCLEGLPPDVVWSRSERGEVLVVKPTLLAGYVRQGFYFSRSATLRAVREWEVSRDSTEALLRLAGFRLPQVRVSRRRGA